MATFLKAFLFCVLLTLTVFSQDSTSKQKELIEKAAAAFQKDKFDEAISLTKDVIDLIKQSGKEKSNEMVTALTTLAIYERNKIQDEEKPLLEKPFSVKDGSAQFDPLRNEAAEAESNLRRGLDICRELGKSDSAVAAAVMSELAIILQKNYFPQTIDISRKRIDEAESFFSQAIQLQEKTLGETDENTLQTLLNFIMLYDKFGNYEKILLFAPKYIINAGQKYGQNDKNLLPVLKIYASTLYTVNRDDELKITTERIAAISGQKKGELFSIKGLENRRIPTSSPFPQIPPQARQFINGSVRIPVKVEVDETGNVISAKAEGDAYYLLRESAEDAAKRTTFRPLNIGGKPIVYRGVIAYIFGINIKRS